MNEKAQNRILIEGQNWRHFEKAGPHSRTLAVFYSPVGVRYPILPYFRKTESLECARLLISPFTDEFFQDCIDSTAKIIDEVSDNYDRTIHFGYSMGAYAALRFGSVDPKCEMIFALSPHFVLDRAGSRSARLMNGPVSYLDNDVREHIRIGRKPIFLALSCFDTLDGVQILDSLPLQNAEVQKHYIFDSHYMPSINKPVEIVNDFLRDRRLPEINRSMSAGQSDLEDCIAAFELSNTNHSRDDFSNLYRSQSKIPQYHYWVARRMSDIGLKLEALPPYMHSFVLARKHNIAAPEFGISMANTLADLHFDEVALGFYKHYLSLDPKLESARNCAIDLLRRRNRLGDIALIDDLLTVSRERLR